MGERPKGSRGRASWRQIMDGDKWFWRGIIKDIHKGWAQAARLSSKAITNNRSLVQLPYTSSLSSLNRFHLPSLHHDQGVLIIQPVFLCVSGDSCRWEPLQTALPWSIVFTAFLWSASVGKDNGLVLNSQIQNRLCRTALHIFSVVYEYLL